MSREAWAKDSAKVSFSRGKIVLSALRASASSSTQRTCARELSRMSRGFLSRVTFRKRTLAGGSGILEYIMEFLWVQSRAAGRVGTFARWRVGGSLITLHSSLPPLIHKTPTFPDRDPGLDLFHHVVGINREQKRRPVNELAL